LGCAKRGVGQRHRLRERPGEECLSNPYIKLSDGRPTETEGTSEMKKYLIASILIVGFAGSAYAVTGQFGNMCSWGHPLRQVGHPRPSQAVQTPR